MQSEEPPVTEYDLWTWHTSGAFPKDQLPEQGYVHIGTYLAWLANHEMLDPEWASRSGANSAVAAVIARSETPCALRDLSDGRLASDMLTAEGSQFTSAYYAPEYGYPRDWRWILGRRADRYDVPDGWETYDRIAPLIDRRYAAWVARGKPELMPMPSLLPSWLTFWRPQSR
jgi:hypothetical protein